MRPTPSPTGPLSPAFGNQSVGMSPGPLANQGMDQGTGHGTGGPVPIPGTPPGPQRVPPGGYTGMPPPPGGGSPGHGPPNPGGGMYPPKNYMMPPSPSPNQMPPYGNQNPPHPHIAHPNQPYPPAGAYGGAPRPGMGGYPGTGYPTPTPSPYDNRPMPNHIPGQSPYPPYHYNQGWNGSGPPGPGGSMVPGPGKGAGVPNSMPNSPGHPPPPPSQRGPPHFLRQHLQQKMGYIPSAHGPPGYGGSPSGSPSHPSMAPQGAPTPPDTLAKPPTPNSRPIGSPGPGSGSQPPTPSSTPRPGEMGSHIRNGDASSEGGSSSGSGRDGANRCGPTSFITTGPDGLPINDDASQNSTISNASQGSDERASTPRKEAMQQGMMGGPGGGGRLSHPPTPGGMLSPHGGMDGSGEHPGIPPMMPPNSMHDPMMNAQGAWPPRLPTSPVFNCHMPPPELYRQKMGKPDALMRLYDMDENPERKMWVDKLLHFMEERRTPITACPTISKHPLDLFRLYFLVKEAGGFMEVTKNKTWKDIAGSLGIGASSSAAYTLRKHYTKHLLPFECKFDLGGIDPQPIINQVEAGSKKKNKSSSSSVPSPGSSSSQDSFGPPGQGMDGYGHHGYGGYSTAPGGPGVYPPPPVSGAEYLPGPPHPPPPSHPGMAGVPNHSSGENISVSNPFDDQNQYGRHAAAVAPYSPYSPGMAPRPPQSYVAGYPGYPGTTSDQAPGMQYGSAGATYPPPPQPTPPLPQQSQPSLPQQSYPPTSRGYPPMLTPPSSGAPPPQSQPQPAVQSGPSAPVTSSLSSTELHAATPTPATSSGPMTSTPPPVSERMSPAPPPPATSAPAPIPGGAYPNYSPSPQPVAPSPQAASYQQARHAPYSQYSPQQDHYQMNSGKPGYLPGGQGPASQGPGPGPGVVPQPPQPHSPTPTPPPAAPPPPPPPAPTSSSLRMALQGTPTPQMGGPNKVGYMMQPMKGSVAPSSGKPLQAYGSGPGGMYGGKPGMPPGAYPPTGPARPPAGPPAHPYHPTYQQPQPYGWQGSQYGTGCSSGPPQWGAGPAPRTEQWVQQRYPGPPQQAAPSTYSHPQSPSPWSGGAMRHPSYPPQQRPPFRDKGPMYPLPPTSVPSKAMPHGTGLAQQAMRRDYGFPPDSVEAVAPLMAKRRRLNRCDVAPVDPWRIMMALKSGLLCETTWALDILNVLTFDDSSVLYFGLQWLPSLLDTLLEFYRKALGDMFDICEDLEINYDRTVELRNKMQARRPPRRQKAWYEPNRPADLRDVDDLSDVEIDLGVPKLEESENSQLQFVLRGGNFTRVTREGKPVIVNGDGKNVFVLDTEREWDIHEGFEVGADEWQLGYGDTTRHIVPPLKCDLNVVPLVRVLPDKKSKMEKENTEVDLVQKEPEKVEDKSSCRNNVIPKLRNCDVKKRSLESVLMRIKKDTDALESDQPVKTDDDDGESKKDEPETAKEEEKESSESSSKDDSAVVINGIKVRDPSRRTRRKNLEHGECYPRDEPSLNLVTEGQDIMSRRAIAISTILRNLSFIPGNDAELSRSSQLLLILGKLLLLFHEHDEKSEERRTTPIAIVSDADDVVVDSDTDLTLEANDWWHEYLPVLRENALVMLANMSGALELWRFPEAVCRPVLDGLLHWAACSSAEACDPFPSLGPHSPLSPQRLALEALVKLSVQADNVDLILATPPWSRLERLVSQLSRWLSRSYDQVLREFSLNLIAAWSSADEITARLVANQSGCIGLLLSFVEQAESTALSIANTHGVALLRDNPDAMGTSLDMLRRAARALHHLSLVPANRKPIVQHEARFLSLVMSQILDQQVASILAQVLFNVSPGTDGS